MRTQQEIQEYYDLMKPFFLGDVNRMNELRQQGKTDAEIRESVSSIESHRGEYNALRFALGLDDMKGRLDYLREMTNARI